MSLIRHQIIFFIFILGLGSLVYASNSKELKIEIDGRRFQFDKKNLKKPNTRSGEFSFRSLDIQTEGNSISIQDKKNIHGVDFYLSRGIFEIKGESVSGQF